MMMPTTSPSMRIARGFTLIELMVAVAIVGILTMIALPSYQVHIQKGKRAAAQAQMMDIANREVQFLLANRSYASKTVLTDSGYGLPPEVANSYTYDIAIGTGTVPGFTINFTAIGGRASDGNLSLSSSGEKLPAAKW